MVSESLRVYINFNHNLDNKQSILVSHLNSKILVICWVKSMRRIDDILNPEQYRSLEDIV